MNDLQKGSYLWPEFNIGTIKNYLDKNMRDRFKGNEYFDACAEFCEKYDQNAFDPDFDTMPLSAFEPMVRRLFAKSPDWP